jgi:predicted Zn-dependent protease
MRAASFVFFSLTLFAQSSLQDKQAEIDRQIVETIRRSTTPVERREVQDYVEELGERLDVSGVAGTFSTVSVKHTNALHEPVALPGGSFLVPVSLLLTAKDEAEFAGMLAQTIARGPLRFKSDAGSIPLIFIENFDSDILLRAFMSADVIDRRREKELQADAAAIRSMSRVGFDPSALLRYIERVQPPDRPRSPFPARADRIAALQKAIRDLPPALYAQSDEFYVIQEYVRPLPAPPSTPIRPQSRPTLFRKSDSPE